MTDNGWAEYKQLFLTDRERNSDEHKQMFERLETINTQLTEMRVERRFSKWALGVVIPLIVAAVVTGAAKAMGF